MADFLSNSQMSDDDALKSINDIWNRKAEPAPPAKPGILSDIIPHLAIGANKYVSLPIGGIAQIAGDITGSKGLTDFGNDWTKNATDYIGEQEKVSPTQKFQDISSVGDAARWGVQQVAEMAPQIVAGMVSGGAGGAAGKALAPVLTRGGIATADTLAGLGGKEAAAIAGEYGAEKGAQAALALRGAQAAQIVNPLAMESTMIYQGMKDGEKDPYRALAYGALAALPDIVVPGYVMEKTGAYKTFPGMKKIFDETPLLGSGTELSAGQRLADVGKTIATATAGGTGQEALQTVIERIGSRDSLQSDEAKQNGFWKTIYDKGLKTAMHPEAWDDIVESSAAGGLMGGLEAIGGHGLGHLAEAHQQALAKQQQNSGSAVVDSTENPAQEVTPSATDPLAPGGTIPNSTVLHDSNQQTAPEAQQTVESLPTLTRAVALGGFDVPGVTTSATADSTITQPAAEPTELDQAKAWANQQISAGQTQLMQNKGISDESHNARIVAEYRKAGEKVNGATDILPGLQETGAGSVDRTGVALSAVQKEVAGGGSDNTSSGGLTNDLSSVSQKVNGAQKEVSGLRGQTVTEHVAALQQEKEQLLANNSGTGITGGLVYAPEVTKRLNEINAEIQTAEAGKVTNTQPQAAPQVIEQTRYTVPDPKRPQAVPFFDFKIGKASDGKYYANAGYNIATSGYGGPHPPLTPSRFSKGHSTEREALLAAASEVRTKVENAKDPQGKRYDTGKYIKELDKFLTELPPENRGGKSPSSAKPANKRRQLDTSKDSLAVAIAKLGGINRTEIDQQTGTGKDLAHTLNSQASKETGTFLHAISTKGIPLDRMREALVEQGYLKPSDDINVLLDKLDSASRGQLLRSSHSTDAGADSYREAEIRYSEMINAMTDSEYEEFSRNQWLQEQVQELADAGTIIDEYLAGSDNGAMTSTDWLEVENNFKEALDAGDDSKGTSPEDQGQMQQPAARTAPGIHGVDKSDVAGKNTQDGGESVAAPDRRTDSNLRAAWESLTPEEQFRQAHTDAKTGALNNVAWKHDFKAGDIAASMDVSGLGYINDTYGHPTGDTLLSGLVKVLQKEGIEVYRVGGDEFATFFPAGFTNHDTILAKAQQAVAGMVVEAVRPDGTVVNITGWRLDYGTGTDFKTADAGLYANRQEQAAAGTRNTAKGSRPYGLSEEAKSAAGNDVSVHRTEGKPVIDGVKTEKPQKATKPSALRTARIKNLQTKLDNGTLLVSQRDELNKLTAIENPPSATVVDIPAGFGDNNSMFTKEKADKARAILRAKLNQLNAGLDPEMITAGIDIAGYYIEGGFRTFKAYSGKMIEDLGEAITPFLKSFYLAVRNYPGFNNKDMNNEADIDELQKVERVEQAITPKILSKHGNKKMRGDYGVADINGYTAAGEKAKSAFLSDAKSYLKEVGQVLKDNGYTPEKINSNPGGVAGSGDVSLLAFKEGSDIGVYVTIGAGTSLPMVSQSPSGVQIMYRATTRAKKYQGLVNRWDAGWDSTTGSLAEKMLVEAQKHDQPVEKQSVLPQSAKTLSPAKQLSDMVVEHYHDKSGQFIGPDMVANSKAALEKIKTFAKENNLPVPPMILGGISEANRILAKENEPSTAAAKSTAPDQIAAFVLGKLKTREKITFSQLVQEAGRAYGSKLSEGKFDIKDVYDALELGVNQRIAESAMTLNTHDTLEQAKQKVVDLQTILDLLPTQTRRTDEMEEFQQFSTPPTYGYVAAWAANITEADDVLEPSAGIGGLAVFAKNAGAVVNVNELSKRRHDLLNRMDFDKIFNENGEQINNILPKDVRPTVILMNPPFSSTAGRIKGERKSANGATHIEQALKRLEPNGRLVAIVGEGMADNRPAFRIWWDKIKKEYTVLTNVGTNGEGFRKYGTTFDNQVLVIDKSGPTVKAPITGKVETVAELLPLLEGVRNDRLESTRQTEQRTDEPAGQGVARESGKQAGFDWSVPVATGGVRSGQRTDGERSSAGNQRDSDTGSTGTDVGTDGANSVHVDGERPAGRSGRGGEPVTGKSDGVDGTLESGVAEPSGLNVQAKKSEKNTATLTDSVFEPYQPQRLSIPGAQPHPGHLVQSAAMATVDPPAPTYSPKLPKSVITGGKLSIAQLETVVYAGQAHEQTLPDGSRRGFFIGDGTGVGKVREISGIILDNFAQGRKKAIWVSERAALVSDAKRDFEGTGGDPAKVFDISRTKPGNAVAAKDGVLFTTYTTLGSGLEVSGGDKVTARQNKAARLDQIITWLGKDFDGVIAFDEAHNMQSAIAEKGKRGNKKASLQGLAGVELQKRLPNARVLYVSATGATNVSNLAYADRLGIWGEGTPFPSKQEFINQIQSGGVAAMELVARDLKAMGSYIARSLSYDDVKYARLEHKLTSDQKDIYNELAKGWQIVLTNIDKAIETTSAGLNSQAKSAAYSAFWGAQQRFFNQVITSMQMPSVLEDVRKQVADGKAAVLQLVNTNEAVQERQLAMIGPEDTLEELDMTPRENLMQFIENSFPTQEFEEYEDDDGNRRSRPVVDASGNPVQNAEAVQMKEQLLDRLGAIKVPDGPMEMLLNQFGPDAVAEVTGRGQRIVYRTDDGVRHKVVEKRGKAMVEADADAFMNDKKQILVFSDAGGTGRSYHADLSKTNQRPRVHYLVQPGWRADKAVQGFGRTHRTNQASAPEYKLVSTDLKGQRRFISSIARRLDQLGALTKGERRTGSQGLFKTTDNLESAYAGDALHRLMVDSFRGNSGLDFADIFQQKMGLRGLIDDRSGTLNETKLPTIPQFLNRILSLEIPDQNRVFDAFMKRLEQNIERAAANGTLETGLENYHADKVAFKAEQTVYTEPKSGAETKYVQMEASHKVQKLSFDEAQKLKNLMGFYKNIASGKVWAALDYGTSTDAKGNVTSDARLVGQTARQSRIVEQSELSRNWDQRWEKLDEKTALPLWDEQLAKTKDFHNEYLHMISGTILPIWDRLPQGNRAVRVLRVQTDDGRRYLGRMLQEDAVNGVLKNLGATPDAVKYNAADALQRVQDGAIAQLSNGWRLKRSYVAGQWRVELIGDDLWKHDAELTKAGVFKERHNFQTRYFVQPNEATIEALTASRPVVEVTGGSGNANFKLTDSPSTGIKANEAQDWVATLPIAKHVNVVQSIADLPENASTEITKAQVNPARVQAMELHGTIHVIADNVPDLRRVKALVIGHELAHAGQEKKIVDLAVDWFKRTKEGKTDQAKTAQALLQRTAASYGYDLSDGKQFRQAVQEATAAIAEQVADGTLQPVGLMQRLFMYIKHWLRQNGLISHVSDSELSLAVAEMLRIGEKRLSVGFGGSEAQFAAAWHGSPTDFNQFSTKNIGEGEGAQSYGYGLYFAGSKDVANFYKDKLSRGTAVPMGVMEQYFQPGRIVNGYGGPDKVVSFNKGTGPFDWSVTVHGVGKEGNRTERQNRTHATMPKWSEIEKVTGYKPGKLYHVELAPSENEYLLWDKPLSEQSEEVRTGLKDAFDEIVNNETDYHKASLLSRQYKEMLDKDDKASGAYIYKNIAMDMGDQSASEYLHSLGIRGIKYLDGSSRGKGEGNYNYVIFNDADVSIQAKFALSPAITSILDRAKETFTPDFTEGMAKGIGQILNPLDFSRTRKWFESVAPDSVKRAMGWLFANPVYQAERDAHKSPFVDAGIAREENKIGFQLALMGWDGNTKESTFFSRVNDTVSSWHNPDKATAWGKIQSANAALTGVEQRAVNALLIEGDRQSRVYSSLNKALTHPRIAAAKPTEAAFKVYKDVRSHIDTVVANERERIFIEMARKGGVDEDTIKRHITDYRQSLSERPGWLPRNHGEGRHQVNVYHIVDGLKFDVKSVKTEGHGDNSSQAYLPYYAGPQATDMLTTIVKEINGKYDAVDKEKRLKFGAYINGKALMANGQMIVTGSKEDVAQFLKQAQGVIPAVKAKNEQYLVDLKADRDRKQEESASLAELRELDTQIKAASDTRVRVKVFMQLHESHKRAEKALAGVNKDMKGAMPVNFREGDKYESEYKIADGMTESAYGDLAGDFAMERAQMEALKRATQSGELSKEEAAKLRNNIIKSSAEVLMGRGAGRHQIQRAPYMIEGYDSDNALHLYDDYMTSTAGMLSKALYAREQFENFRYAPPEVKVWAETYIKDSLRNMGLADRISGNARSIATFMYLGGKVSSILVNGTQVWTLGVAELGRRSKQNSVKTILKAQVDIVKGRLSAAEKELFNSKIWKLQEMETAVNEMSGAHEGTTGKISQHFHELINKTMMPFQEMELMNRRTMILAAYRAGMADGMSKTDAIDFALDVNRKTNFEMSRANLPGWARNPAGRTVYALQSFVWNNWNWIYNRATSGEKADMLALLKYSAMIAAIGGASAMAGGDEADKLYRRIYGRSIKMDLQHWTHEHLKDYGFAGDRFNAFIWHGAIGGAGINISNSMRLNIPMSGLVTGESSAGEAAMGVWSGMLDKGVKTAGYLAKGKLERAAEAAAPEAIAAPMKAYRMATQGATTSHGKPVFDENGRPVKYSAGEAATRALGFQPLEQSSRAEIANSLTKINAKWNEDRQDVLDGLRAGSATGRDVQKFNIELRKSQAFPKVGVITADTVRSTMKIHPDKKAMLQQRAEQ